MIQKYRYTSLHYLIKRFTIVSLLYKGDKDNNSLKINVTFMLKLHHPDGWSVVKDHHSTF